MSIIKSIHFATAVEEINPSMSDYYDHIINEIYALNLIGPTDASEMSTLNNDYEQSNFSIIKELSQDDKDDYTHIIQDSDGDLYAVRIAEGDWTVSFLKNKSNQPVHPDWRKINEK